jgi:GSH-dependent disulfide-bond oxidoreductase
MITLYGMTSPNVVKIVIALEELQLPFELKTVDVFAGQQFDPGFVELNPNAKVPVIVDSDGPGGKPITLFESGAILIYLAEKTGKLLPTEPTARYDVLQWLMVQLTGVGPMFGQYVHFFRFASQGNDYAVSRYRTQVKRLCEVLDARLAKAAYLGGAEYSIADIATFPWARNIKNFPGAEAGAYPHLSAWVDAIDKRPAAARAVAMIEKVRATLTTPDKSAPEILDKMFGRGKHALA